MEDSISQAVRVLVVDDQATFRQLARQLLEQGSDFEVVGEAESGEEALEMAQRLTPDLVLMDVYLGGMNGLAATRLLLRHYSQARVVLLSIHSDKEFHRLAVQVGALGFIPKAKLTLEVLRQLAGLSSPQAPTG